jgi:hypothetical protein
MRFRHMLAGTSGLVAAVAWTSVLVAQGPQYLLGARTVAGSGEPIWLRLFALPPLLQGAVGALLVIPMALAGIAVMFQMNKATARLRGMALAGFTTAALVVIAFGTLMVSNLGAASPTRLGRNAQLDLVGAAVLLILHGATALFLSTSRYNGRSAATV